MLEIEVKVRIEKTADVESRLRALGAFQEAPRCLEDDRLFDFPDRRLSRAGCLLRLRSRTDGAVVTFKEKVPTSLHAKVRREVETRLSDGQALRTILEELGMEPIWRYQKYRTTYSLGGIHVLVDEVPIGNFLELEGPEGEIDRWAGALGYAREDYILESYRGLHNTWRRERRLPEGDMVFEEGTA